ncbi:MAG: YciI family protein [Candidatus Izemoplasmatales bacterium]|nr:YciI family protein [Candidatus Izemoplasmatales bacterium]
MLFMLLVKASRHTETGGAPNKELQLQMDRYNDELEQAGVRIMSKGLYPTENALRIAFPNESSERVVTKGPFSPTEDLIAGFFLLEVKNKEEAISWAMKAPDPMGNGEGRYELRQVI